MNLPRISSQMTFARRYPLSFLNGRGSRFGRQFSTCDASNAPSPFMACTVGDRGQCLGNGSSLLKISKIRQSYFNQQLHTSVRLNQTSGGDDKSVQPREKMLPPLMEFPAIVWPRFINAVRNWFFINFIIKPYFDKEFSMNDFLVGAKEAVAVVADKLSEGKLDELEGLVESSALVQLRESLSKFTVFQQQLLRVATEDIFFTFPYQIGIIIPDEPPREQYAEGVKPPPQTRHVEITVCLHILRGLAEQQKKGDEFNFHTFAQDETNKYNVMVCNYRFFKDFTEGTPDPTWIINMVNHFLPAEVKR